MVWGWDHSRSCHVTVVDDNRDLLEITVETLHRATNYQLSSFCCPHTALRALSRRTSDALVVDYLMPKMKGVELLNRLERRGIVIPTVIVTGMKTMSFECPKGVVSIVMKPWGVETLVEAVAEAVMVGRVAPRFRRTAT